MPTSFFEKSSLKSQIILIPRLQLLISQPGLWVRRSPLFALALTGMAGIFFADHSLWLITTLIALGGLTLAGFAWRKRSSRPLILGALISFLGFASAHHLRIEQIEAFPLAQELTSGKEIEMVGEGWIADRVNATERSQSTLLEIESLSIQGVEIPCRHRVPVWIQRTDLALSYGDRLSFSGLLRPLSAATAPGGFDPASFYFRESGSLARLEIREGDSLDLLPGKSGSWLIQLAQTWRDHLEKGLLTDVSPERLPHARLIAAMSLGARENTPEDLEDSFRRSGTMHLFAVSGLHVGVVAGLLLGGLLLCRVPRRTAVLLVIPLILFYAVLTGLRPSAIRAAVMLSVVLASFAVKEKPNLLNSLSFAAILILAFDTQQLFLPGFQLSFAVLLFLVLFASPLQKALSGPWMTDPFLPQSLRSRLRRTKDGIVSGLAAGLAVSAVSWLGSLGLLVWHFQSYAPVGVFANVLMVPLASLIVSLAVITLALFSVQVTWLSALLHELNLNLAVLLTSLAQFFGGLPGAYQNSGNFSEQSPSLPAEALALHVMSEEGGGAILVEFPSEREATRSRWMIDSGGSRTYRSQMLPLLRSKAINHLDGLILTHGDTGHIGEAATLLAQFRPALLFESPLSNRSPVYPEIDELADRFEVQRVSVSEGTRIRPHPEVLCRILAPGDDSTGRLADDRSLVLTIEYGEMSLLLTADAGFDTEKELLAEGVDLRADLWIRGQHTDSPPPLSEFVSAVSPRAVISSSSEFPAAQRISPNLRSLFEETDVPLFPLDETGVVTVLVTPNQIEVIPFRNGKSLETLLLKKL